MPVANSQHHTSNGIKRESFHAALHWRVRVSHPNLFIFLKHLGEVSRDTVGDWDRLTRDCQIQLSKKTTALSDRRIKTFVDKFTSGIYTHYEFLSDIRGQNNLHIPRQLIFSRIPVLANSYNPRVCMSLLTIAFVEFYTYFGTLSFFSVRPMLMSDI